MPVMPGGTVLIPMGAGTGSWRHNRVAGVGIEPTYRGYEPRDQPLVHPARPMILSFTRSCKRQSMPNSRKTAS